MDGPEWATWKWDHRAEALVRYRLVAARGRGGGVSEPRGFERVAYLYMRRVWGEAEPDRYCRCFFWYTGGQGTSYQLLLQRTNSYNWRLVVSAQYY